MIKIVLDGHGIWFEAVLFHAVLLTVRECNFIVTVSDYEEHGEKSSRTAYTEGFVAWKNASILLFS